MIDAVGRLDQTQEFGIWARASRGRYREKKPAEPGSTEAAMREHLVVLNMSTTHRPEPFADYGEARERFIELRERAVTLPEPDRRRR